MCFVCQAPTRGYVVAIGDASHFVSDDPDNCGILSASLKEHGAHVEIADSAAQSPEKINSNLPDVLISDIGMPGTDGCRFVQEMRRLPGRPSKIPAIAGTAFARSEDRSAVLKAGFNAHLAKPINVPS